jgi:hypothetical protein
VHRERDSGGGGVGRDGSSDDDGAGDDSGGDADPTAPAAKKKYRKGLDANGVLGACVIAVAASSRAVVAFARLRWCVQSSTAASRSDPTAGLRS